MFYSVLSFAYKLPLTLLLLLLLPYVPSSVHMNVVSVN